MQFFVPITKVDAVQRLVYGSLATEAVDKSGEIFDYATSKPLVEAWSGEIAKATDGKSVGNLRAMHGKVAAGKFTELICDDENKRVDVCAKVVDDAEWNKVTEGVYTGFSIGGAYVKKWKDGEHVRYTAKPNEGSLVDLPCNPEAQFAMIKEGGQTEMKKFSAAPAAPKATAAETTPPEPVQVWKAADGSTHLTKAAAKEHDAEQARLAGDPAARLEAAASGLGKSLDAAEGARAAAGDPPKDAAAPVVEKRDFSDKKRSQMAEEGTAMKDGSFPIANKKDLANAVKAFGRSKNKVATKKHIIARAKALKAEDQLPDSWKGDDKDEESEKAARFGDLRKGLVRTESDGKVVVLRKGLYGVARLAGLIEELEWLHQSCEMEAAQEGDGSELPSELKQNIATLCATLRAMVEEETNELLDQEEHEEFGELLEMAARPRGTNALAKILGAKAPAWLAKVGARHSKANAEHLQKAHDHIAKMGIGCMAKAAAAGDLGKAGAVHSKADAENLTKAHDCMKAVGADCEKMAEDEVDGAGEADEAAEDPKAGTLDGGGKVPANLKGAPAGDLAKLAADNERLTKAIETVEPMLKSFADRIKSLEDQPLPSPRQLAAGTRAVTKNADNGGRGDDARTPEEFVGDFEKWAKDHPSDATEFLIRVAQQRPVQMLPR